MATSWNLMCASRAAEKILRPPLAKPSAVTVFVCGEMRERRRPPESRSQNLISCPPMKVMKVNRSYKILLVLLTC